MKYYIDFDNTLFDTKTFYGDLIKVFNANGIDLITLINNDKALLNKLFAKKINTYYLPNDNIDKLTCELNNFTDSISKYLYNDSIKFLKYLKDKNKELILLTYGNKNYQQYKILNSGIKDYFNDIIITEIPKYKLDLDYKNGIFIDDNVDEIIWFKKMKAKVIRIKRANNKHSIITLDNVIEYTSFDELMNDKQKLDNLL